MNLIARAAYTILADPALFSRHVIGLPLHQYQLEPLRAILNSILHRQGLEFLLIFPRQAGKDEAIGQLQTYLLNLFQRQEAGIVHVYPTRQQIPIGATRLDRRLANPWNSKHTWKKANPPRQGLGTAQVTFFSGHPDSHSEGATANLLLIINECQDQVELIIERRFVMMTASTNATRVYVGTVRTTSDYLWHKKLELERLEAQDKQRRIFMIGPERIGRENPDYRRFVASQVASKGRQHPSVKTELFLEPLDSIGGLFDERRLALMFGQHHRLRRPEPDEIYAALVDVAGQDEATTDVTAELANPGRDYTVATIVHIIPTDGPAPGPTYEAVDVFVDHGSRHFEDVPGRPSLAYRLEAYLNHWSVIHTVCDESGVGAGLTSWLIARHGTAHVTGYNFARARGKAQLGADFLSVIETGRFRYWQEPTGWPGPIGEDAWLFHEQAARCQYSLAEGQPIETGLRWAVPDNATWTDLEGNSHPLHDDRLISAALCAVLDKVANWQPARSETIAPYDPVNAAHGRKW